MSNEAGNRKRLIVIIENEEIVLTGYRMLFESWGYDVVGGGCGEDVLALLEGDGGSRRRPDAILADYRLHGGCTGVMAIKKVQDAFDGEKTPAVLVTGDTAPSWLREAAESGYPILYKPVKGDRLRDVLESVIAGSGGGLG